MPKSNHVIAERSETPGFDPYVEPTLDSEVENLPPTVETVPEPEPAVETPLVQVNDAESNPEHEKLNAVEDHYETLLAFIHWLDERKGVYLAEPLRGGLVYATGSAREFVLDFLEIDHKILAAEQVAMLTAIIKVNPAG